MAERAKEKPGELRQLIENDPELKLFTLDEIAEAYGLSDRTLKRYIADGQLRAVRLGRTLRVSLTDWRDFLRSRQVEGGNVDPEQ